MERRYASVVIPSYNCAAWLQAAVDSAYRLGPGAVEVIVVDDGSTDETPSLCARLRAQYPNLIGIRQANGGLSAARNTGIAAATGEFIVLLDADDELLSFDLNHLQDFDGDVVRVSVQEIDGEHERPHAEPAGMWTGKTYLADRFSSRKFYTPSWAYIYRREWLLEHQLSFYPGLIHEDNLFTVQALLAARRVKVTPDPLYRYIRRDGSITREVNQEKLMRRIASLDLITRELTQLANLNPDVDLRWWIDEVVHNAAALTQQIKSPWARMQTIWMHLRFMFTYRGMHAPALRWEQRERLKKLLFGYPKIARP